MTRYLLIGTISLLSSLTLMDCKSVPSCGDVLSDYTRLEQTRNKTAEEWADFMRLRDTTQCTGNQSEMDQIIEKQRKPVPIKKDNSPPGTTPLEGPNPNGKPPSPPHPPEDLKYYELAERG